MTRGFLAGVVFLAACATVPATTPQTELARVDQQPITVSDLLSAFTARHGGHAKFLGGEVELRKFLSVVIDQRLMIEEAYALGLDGERDVKTAVDAFREKKSIEKLLQIEIDDKARATDEEIREAWETKTTRVVQMRQIVLPTQLEADEIHNAVLHGADFEIFARRCSTAASRNRGGRLQPLGWGSIDPVLESAVFAAEPGELLPVIKTREGWQVVQIDMTMDMPKPELAKATTQIRTIIEERKREERRRQFSDELWEKYGVEVVQKNRSPRTLARLRKSDPRTVLVTWEGGQLTLEEFATEVELRMVARLPEERGTEAVDEQLRKTVHTPLVKREAEARKIAEMPDLAEKVRKHQEDLMFRVLFEQHVMKGVTVSDEEIAAYHASHQEELSTRERRRVAHIVVDDEEKARALRDRIAAGEDFGEVAKTSSKDVMSAPVGGDLGWIDAKSTPESFKSVLSLAASEVSLPLKSEHGWHLVRVTEIEAARPLTLDEATPSIRETLMGEKQKEKRTYWLAKLRDNASIQMNDAAIRSYVKENPFGE